MKKPAILEQFFIVLGESPTIGFGAVRPGDLFEEAITEKERFVDPKNRFLGFGKFR